MDEDRVERKKGPRQRPGSRAPDEVARAERTRKKGPTQPVGDDAFEGEHDRGERHGEGRDRSV